MQEREFGSSDSPDEIQTIIKQMDETSDYMLTTISSNNCVCSARPAKDDGGWLLPRRVYLIFFSSLQ